MYLRALRPLLVLQNRSGIRAADNTQIRPFWRALFGHLWYFALVDDIEQKLAQVGQQTAGLGLMLPFLYLTIRVAASVSPSLTVNMMGLFAVLTLLPAQAAMTRVHAATGAEVGHHRGFTLLNIVGMSLGLPWLLIGITLVVTG